MMQVVLFLMLKINLTLWQEKIFKKNFYLNKNDFYLTKNNFV